MVLELCGLALAGCGIGFAYNTIEDEISPYTIKDFEFNPKGILQELEWISKDHSYIKAKRTADKNRKIRVCLNSRQTFIDKCIQEFADGHSNVRAIDVYATKERADSLNIDNSYGYRYYSCTEDLDELIEVLKKNGLHGEYKTREQLIEELSRQFYNPGVPSDVVGRIIITYVD